MKIAFIGDIHGRIFHTLAVLDYWQIRNNCKFDAIIQVGDLGAYPNPDEEMLKSKFVLQDPTELDFSRFIYADENLQKNLQFIRQRFQCSIWFIRGNHEDFAWLEEVSAKSGETISSIDPFDLLQYVSDGAIIDVGNSKVAFLGGIETEITDERSFNEKAYSKLIDFKPGEVDILVTHDAPYGVGDGFKGEIQGSRKITELIETIQPRYLIAGHYHHMNGPRVYGKTTYMGLNILIPPIKKDKLGRVQQGSIGILDTEEDRVDFVTDDWLSKFDREFVFNNYIEKLKSII
jgi:Icc-related predicted phosphoesterase